MYDGFVSKKLPGQAEGTRRDFSGFAALGREPEKVRSSDPRRENGLSSARQPLDRSGVGSTLAESRLPRPIIDAFTEPLDGAASAEPRERLRDRSKGKVAEVFEPPDAFAAAFDPSINLTRDPLRAR